jgi:DNA-binding CsgD family transcriptional regulator
MGKELTPGPTEVIEFLAQQPTPDTICHWLVTRYLEKFGALSSILMALRRTGNLEMLGSFGLDAEVCNAFASRKLWEKWPITDTARTGSGLYFDSFESLVEGYESMKPYSTNSWITGSLITLPLKANSLTVGALGVTFVRELPKAALPIREIEYVVAVLALNIDKLVQSANKDFDKTWPETDLVEDPSGKPLTERQKFILTLMSEGKSNAVIAHSLGYSVSTVAQESMRIFRKIGLANRRAVIEHVKAYGLKRLLESDD